MNFLKHTGIAAIFLMLLWGLFSFVFPKLFRHQHTAKCGPTYAFRELSEKVSKYFIGKKQLPCLNRGWICAYSKPPCSDKKSPMYPNQKLSQSWKHSCWDTIGFSINEEQYYQYCYRAEHQNGKASFMIKAHSDLDCDGKLSTIIQKGNVENKAIKLKDKVSTDFLE